ncbi:uncharacterized protein LOC117644540 [Thrips palmi]|uniref:Uncharacterized protein LOC117644540 n=1 Tax=Thrips palmi TaxID=161013 RepID=A0A6P8YRK5_THRPL|nr:uncharacterized protein LOC117644540 [Thrips palmi]
MEARPSMLTVVKNGLASTNRTTYLHRLLYIGDHKLGRSGVEVHMRNLVNAQAESAREEALTGFLLAYQNYFIHLVEGSESTLTRHLDAVVNSDPEDGSQIGRVKILLEIAHIFKRCMPSWSSRSAVPPTLASQVKQDAAAAEMARHVDAVLSKTLRLMDAVKKLPPGAPLNQQTALQLPEPELLDALLATPLLPDARDVLEEQRLPPRMALYDDVVWPMQSDFVPYNTLEEAIEVVLHDTKPQDAPQHQEEDEEGASLKTADEAGAPGMTFST